MPSADVREQLINRLAGELGSSPASAFVLRLEASGVPPAPVLALLDELEAVSAKIARAAVEALPELDRRAGCAQLVTWLDVGVALAESSGATALKYFKDSPLILGVIGNVDHQRSVLTFGLELADSDANVSWEYLKASPRIVTVVSTADLPHWLEIGVELTKSDLVVGLEYIRQIPALAPVLPWDAVRGWLAFGLKLVTTNAFGKPDYLGTMEYLRTSPGILGDIEAPFRSHVISVGDSLAAHAPAAAIAWLAESAALLRALPSPPWRLKMLQYGGLLAEQDAEAALSYLRRSPELVGLLGGEASAFGRFDNWFKAGMEVLSYSPEGARAYFSAESRKALLSVEEAVSGVPLKQVARRIKLFVQGLCGSEVSIAARTEAITEPAARAVRSADGKTLILPALLRRYPTAEENERLYLVMAAHEAGHLEFGTYRLQMNTLADVAAAVRRRYRRPGPDPLKTLGDVFRLYPQPRLIQDLWTVLEDARVEYLLQMQYPGIRHDLATLMAETIAGRDPAQGLTVRELVVDCLLRLSAGASLSSAVPRALLDEVSVLWNLCQPALRAGASAEDVVRIADEVYRKLEELVASAPGAAEEPVMPETSDATAGPPASERGGEKYRTVENLFFRGEMDADFMAGETEEQAALQPMAEGGSFAERRGAATGARAEQPPGGDAVSGGRSLPSVVEEVLAIDADARPMEAGAANEWIYRYPEWDYRYQDYRVHWCRVIERPADRGSDECVSGTLTAYRSTVRLLRRYFEGLRPPAFRRLAGQPDGEELDIDAVVRRAAEQKAGFEGSDRIYVRREKKVRDVAVAFLIDVSGSTGRQLENGRRVIDVEKESLVLLCEALDAVGDQYALYAYTGQGRAGVEVQTIKNFDERLGTTTAQRLGGLSPRQQNRDGASIRYAIAKLRQQHVRTRLLVLLSDGRPLDGEYKDEYALEDTKAALREARHEGIHPFCVTIDREADSYVRRMYGLVEYTVIDRVESLPGKLPRIYQRLTT
ncbi:MAG TPA: VWA domain-containing protein [Nitrospira sp.]|nr:VWA domain-containing protein [Nitrospira sp.]